MKILFRMTTTAILLLYGWPCVARAQTPATTIGRLEGDDVAAKGSISVIVENGHNTTILASGSDVTVRSGQARIVLAEGGEIDICGPAHFTLLKSNGSITLAMDSGRLHAVLANATPLILYTPLIVATAESISGAAREVSAGVELSGSICISAIRGAVRLDEQLTGESLIVPQGSEMLLPNGQLSSIQNASGKSSANCRCQWLAAKTEATLSTKTTQYAVPLKLHPEQESAPRPVETKLPEQNPHATPTFPVAGGTGSNAGPPATEVPTWKVVMPPLVFDANAPPPPPEPTEETILLVREARVTPAVIFSGTVANPNRPSATNVSVKTPEQTRKKQPSFFAKLFHWLGFGHKSG